MVGTKVGGSSGPGSAPGAAPPKSSPIPWLEFNRDRDPTHGNLFM